MTPAQVAHIMSLVDRHAKEAAAVHAEILYGTSQSYTNEKIKDAKAARAAIEAALRDAPQAEGWVMVPAEIVNRFPEINPSNYDHDDACALNAWGLELVLAAAPTAPAPTEPDDWAAKIMELAHRWAQATYCKGQGRPFEDFDAIQREMCSLLATPPRAAQPEAVGEMKDRLLSSLERAVRAETALRALVDECGNDAIFGWEGRMMQCIKSANEVLAAAPTPTESQPAEAQPDYSGMSREALERHAQRMAQTLADDCTRLFYAKHADGPMMPPSCLCCGQLPEEVAIKHMELPGVVICAKCRGAALSAPTAPAQAEPVGEIVGFQKVGVFEVPTVYWAPGFALKKGTKLYATPPATAAGPSDAERYRLVRRGQHWSVIDGIGNVLRGDDLDAAIDAKKGQP